MESIRQRLLLADLLTLPLDFLQHFAGVCTLGVKMKTSREVAK